MALDRFKTIALLLLLSPVSAGLGLWLIFQGQILFGSTSISVITIAETALGIVLFALAVPMFFSSLGGFGSKNGAEAERWLRWMGRLKPRLPKGSPELTNPSRHRRPALAIILVILVGAILLIPGIGEDRQFPLNQFYGLFSSLWYFYVLSILFASMFLIYYRRLGGYVLGIILCVLSLGTTVPDVLGFLPPSAPTLRTTIIELAILPADLLLAYVSWRAIHVPRQNELEKLSRCS
jgi:hypothetical protein